MGVHQIKTLLLAEVKDFPHRRWHVKSPGKANVMARHALLHEFSCDQRFIRVQKQKSEIVASVMKLPAYIAKELPWFNAGDDIKYLGSDDLAGQLLVSIVEWSALRMSLKIVICFIRKFSRKRALAIKCFSPFDLLHYFKFAA